MNTLRIGGRSLPRPALLVLIALSAAPLACPDATVTSCDGASLQQAVNIGGLITFACLGNITLNNTIQISKDTTISGTGHTISGNGAVGVFVVSAGVTLTLEHLNITNGKAAVEGGGVLNQGGTLNVAHCTFSNN